MYNGAALPISEKVLWFSGPTVTDYIKFSLVDQKEKRGQMTQQTTCEQYG